MPILKSCRNLAQKICSTWCLIVSKYFEVQHCFKIAFCLKFNMAFCCEICCIVVAQKNKKYMQSKQLKSEYFNHCILLLRNISSTDAYCIYINHLKLLKYNKRLSESIDKIDFFFC